MNVPQQKTKSIIYGAMRRAGYRSVNELERQLGMKRTSLNYAFRNPANLRLWLLIQIDEAVGFTDSEWMALKNVYK